MVLFLPSRFDDFAYFYHRYELPRLNYTVCTDPGNLRDLHAKFMPNEEQPRYSDADADRLHHVLKKPIWQVG